MVFCFKNFADQMWEEIVLVCYREKLLKSEAEGRELTKILMQ